MKFVKELLESPFSIHDLVVVLKDVDLLFEPPLHSRLVNKSTVKSFEEYGKKILSEGHVIVQYNSSEIEGFATCYANDFLTYKSYIPLVAVRPKYQKQGVGKRLIEKVLTLAEEKEMKVVTLKTWSGNLEALALYTKLGFKTNHSEGNDLILEMELKA